MSSVPTFRRRVGRACARLATAGSLAFSLASALACGAVAPSRPATTAPAADGHLFTQLPSSYTGVRFENRVTESREMNVFTYRNFYNGGGVALGDLTGDGRPEMVLTSNQGGPKLYVNEGRFQFRDGTDESGLVTKAGSWTTGVTFADVNGDGRLDIYVCKAGSGPPSTRANELWINQGVGSDGVPHFKEEAQAYGVADEGWSTQAVFFDYDRDGDLDLLVINNSPKPVTGFGVFYSRQLADRYSGAKLYRNDGGPNGTPHFTEVTAAAGIYSPQNAFGLGVAVGDVNRDGWPDIYQSNDFFERDYLYINKGDGTFAEVADRAMPVLSQFSMGLDTPSFSSGAAYADLDGDGAPDLVVNNVNGEPFVYRNNARALYPERHYLQVALDGAGTNRFGVGARVTLHVGGTAAGETLMQEESPTRGFESSVDQVLTFGLGAHAAVDTLTVEWPDGRRSTIAGVTADRRLTIHQAQSVAGRPAPARPPLAAHDAGLLTLVADTTALDFAHRAADFVDFDRERLIPKLLSTEGPALAVADVDHDGKTDLLLGGNFEGFKPEVGRAAASYGLVLRGDPSRCRGRDSLCVPFTPLRAAESGFFAPGQTRDIRRVRTRGGEQYVVARDNDRPLLFRRGAATTPHN